MQQVLAALHDLNRRACRLLWRGALSLRLERERSDGDGRGEGERGGAGGKRGDQSACSHGGLLQNLGDSLPEEAAPQEERRGNEGHARFVQRHDEQRIDVALLGFSQPHGRPIDDLFATELNASDQPPDGRMEPEDRAHPFFEDLEEPVAPAHVQQLVIGDRFLHVVRHREDRRRNDDDRASAGRT